MRYWNIRELVDCGVDVDVILFAHAWSGCDSTSAMHRKGNFVSRSLNIYQHQTEFTV